MQHLTNNPNYGVIAQDMAELLLKQNAQNLCFQKYRKEWINVGFDNQEYSSNNRIPYTTKILLRTTLKPTKQRVHGW